MTSSAVAVIGAGPAGCAAAIRLAALGQQVVVFERGSRLKDKPCGDAYLPDALQQMAALGVTLDPDPICGAKSFTQIDLWDATRPIWAISLDGREGWIAPRAAVDQILRDAAALSSELRYESVVLAIDPATPGWELTIRAGNSAASPENFSGVVLATGAANAFSRRYGVAGAPITGASISVYGRLTGITAPMFQFSPLGLAGYGWVFPLADDRVNIGVCAIDSRSANLRAATSRYLERWRPSDIESFRAGAGPMWSDRGSRWHQAGGLVSCGDAAGLVDPLTGEGIAPAMESGIAAADAVHTFLTGGGDSALAAYSNWVKSTFRSRYAETPVRRMWRYLNGATATAASTPAQTP